MSIHPLGRVVPQDDDHLQLYPLRAVMPETVAAVEHVLKLPPYRRQYNQGAEGACVGFGTSWSMSIYHRDGKTFPLFDARWLWNQAKIVDGFPDTNPGDDNGTTVRAAFDVLRAQGDMELVKKADVGPLAAMGVKANRWASNVDEMRTAIGAGLPVTIGVNWYTNFDRPVKRGTEWWIGQGDLGSIRGGHCVCVYGASDKRQAFRVVNNWGVSYPLIWVPYAVMNRLLVEQGEAAVIVAQ